MPKNVSGAQSTLPPDKPDEPIKEAISEPAWRDKFERASADAALIGCGSEELARRGIKALILSPTTWQEALAPRHPHPALGTSVDYLVEPREQEPHKISFHKNETGETVLKTAKNIPLNTGPGMAMFVIDSKFKFYVSPKDPGKFHHSSFKGGQAVFSAGMLKTDAEGHLILISPESGHYQPDNEILRRTLGWFKKQGVDLEHVQVGSKTAREALESLQRQTPRWVSTGAQMGWKMDLKTLKLIDEDLASDNPEIIKTTIGALHEMHLNSPVQPELEAILVQNFLKGSLSTTREIIHLLATCSPLSPESIERLENFISTEISPSILSNMRKRAAHRLIEQR